MKHRNFTPNLKFAKTVSTKRSFMQLGAVALSMSVAVFTGCQKNGAVAPTKPAIATTNQQDELVNTPYGKVPASKVHLVEQGT